jgi:hypothetical protein
MKKQHAMELKMSLQPCLQAAFLFCSAFLTSVSNSAPLPEDDGNIHNGVASCAGSTCHGSVRQFTDSKILHNEFITWTREDRHSKAYQTLLNKDSKLIAQKLGIGAPHTEALCLDCHADNVSAKQRGKKFQLSDGVGCESCHGGSEKWLTSHVKDAHQQNLKSGLYPTEEPEARAALCLSCHYGNDDKFVTHRIMGAGHPRISFELDNFTELMPPHHQVDADYKQRKTRADSMQTWALGQIAFVRQILQQLEHRGLRSEGLFPELSLYDCHSCHHPMSRIRWAARSSTGLGPGVVRLQDANFIMLQALLGSDKPRAEQVRQLTRNLHQATTQGIPALRTAIVDFQKALPELEKALRNRNYSDADIKAVLAQLIQSGVNNEFADYAAAEQAVMAIASLLSTLDTRSALNAKTQETVNARLDALYACTDDDEKYRSSCFTEELKQLRNSLGG